MKNPLEPKKRKRRADSKYRPKYARELREGLREGGMSEAEVCKHFGISRDNYNQWRKSIKAWDDACKQGDLDYQSWWAKTYRDVASGEKEGNAGLLKYAATNVLGWAEKSETKSHHEEEIRIIEITQIEAPKINIIEHENVEQIEYDASESTSSVNPQSD
jgi:hypothetical protein